MPSASEAYAEYTTNFASYERAIVDFDELVSAALTADSIDFRTQPRAKTPLSYFKKIVRKGYLDPRAQCTDLLGLRVVLPLVTDKDSASAAIQASGDLVVSTIEDGRALANPRELRYAGLHLFVTSADLIDPYGNPFVCEVQIKSEAENSWGDTEHRYIYKKPYPVPDDLVRQFERLLVLVELFDKELSDGVAKMRGLEDFRRFEFAQTLDKLLLETSGIVGDDFLSVINLRLLVPNVVELDHYENVVRAYVRTAGDLLRRVFVEHGPGSADFQIDRDWVATQSESLLILAMLRDDPFTLRERVLGTDLYEPCLALAAIVGSENFS